MQVNTRFTFDRIRHDQDNDLHLVLGLTAPKVDLDSKRQPLCVIPVIDLSGSMLGEKLHYAKQSLLKLSEHLTSDDYMGLVSFSSGAKVDARAEKMTVEQKNELRRIIGDYYVSGNTNLSTGLSLAMEMANDLDLPATTLVRIILFTDGQPTHGVTSAEGLCRLVEKAGRASVSAFGYGPDANQDLLSDVSTKGKGNYSFVRDPDSALAAFGRELGGLLSTYGQELEVEVTPRNGHLITEVLSDFEVEEEDVGNVITIKLPQILSEETINLALAVKMHSQKSAGPRHVNAFDVKVSYKMLDADSGKLVDKSVEAKAKVQFVKSGEEQTTPTKAVDEVVVKAQLVKAQIAAEEAAKRGDYNGAVSVLRGVTASANSRGHAAVAAVGGQVSSLYADNKTYGSSGGRRKTYQKAGARGMSVDVSSMNPSDLYSLQEAGLISSNSAQAQYTSSFTKAGPDNVKPFASDSPWTVDVVPVDIGPVSVSVSDVSGGFPVVEPKKTSSKSGEKKLSKPRSSRW